MRNFSVFNARASRKFGMLNEFIHENNFHFFQFKSGNLSLVLSEYFGKSFWFPIGKHVSIRFRQINPHSIVSKPTNHREF